MNIFFPAVRQNFADRPTSDRSNRVWCGRKKKKWRQMFANEQTHTHWTKSKLHSRCTKHSTRKYATLEFLKQFSVLVDSRLSIPWGSCCWVWAHSIPTYIFSFFVHRENVNAKEKLFLRWKWESFREGGNEESALNQQKSRVGSRRSRLRRRDGGETRRWDKWQRNENWRKPNKLTEQAVKYERRDKFSYFNFVLAAMV